MGKGKGKKSGGDGEEGAEMTPLEVAKMLQAENTALQRELAQRQEEASQALAARRELQRRVAELKRDFDEEQRSSSSLTNDMTRQYKAMQEELLNRVNILENTVQELNAKLEESHSRMEEMRREKDALATEKDNEIAEQKQRMTDMAQEFADMLKDTLDKMGERIDVSEESKVDSINGVQAKLSEFKI